MNAAQQAPGLATLQADGFDLGAQHETSAVELLRWNILPDCAKPDADITVLLKLETGECWQGYWDDEAGRWCDVHGSVFADGVVAWSDPEGPAC